MRKRTGTVVSISVIAIMLLTTTLIVFGTNTAVADTTSTVPGVPTGLTASPGNNQETLNWTEPVSDGGNAIDYYVIYQDGIALTGQYTTLFAEITGLTNYSYRFTVAAHNAAGTGPQCYAVYGEPITAPGPPKYYYTIPGDGQAFIEWSGPEWGGNVLYYIVYMDGVDVLHTSNNNFTFTGLNNAQTYVFSFVSHNLAGDSPQDSVNVIPRAVPKAPTGLTATPGNGQLVLNWTAPVNSYAAVIDGYIIYVDGNNVWDTTDNPDALATSTLMHGLNNGQTYNFTVAAHSYYPTSYSGPVGYIGQQSSGVLATPRPDTTNEPTDLSVTPDNGQVALSWTPPSYIGGAAIDYYVIYQNNVDVQHNTTTSGMITGLTNGQTYSFIVAAHNSAGIGHNSSAIEATPYGVPDSPSGLAGALGNGKITLNWTAPVFDGGRDIDYYVIYQDGVALPYHLSGPSTFIAGLIKGQAYSFTVYAHNLAGLSQRSNTVSTTTSGVLTVPGAPTSLTAVPGNNRVSLTWTSPISIGGATIDYYIVYQNGTSIAHPTSMNQIVTGLMNSVSYTFNVAAHNSAGNGSRSSSVSATPIALTAALTVSDAPTGLVATPTNGQISLSWTAPISDGGAVIDYYLIYLNGIVRSDHYTNTSTKITGLTNGQQYNFAITAHNSIGESSKSLALTASPTSVTKVPGVPIGLEATPGNNQITLSWASPNNNGGAAIDYYIVYQDSIDISHTAATSENITGLSNGQSYDYSVAAHNSIGTGTQTLLITATPTMNAVPGIPTDLITTAGSGKVALSWTPPADNSSIDYYIIYQNGVDVGHTSAVSATITGLTNGENYTFAVAAHNAGGAGSQSSAQVTSPSITAAPSTGVTAPGIPTNLITVAGNGKVTLSWTPPSGTSSIDYYIVYQNGVDVSHTPATSATITGLTNGENYTFAVAAHNLGGAGIQSSAQSNSPSSSNSASTSAGNDNMAYLSVGIAVLFAAIIAGFIVVRRNRKKQ